MSAIIWIHAVFIVYTLHIDKSNQVNEQSEQYNHHSGSRLNQFCRLSLCYSVVYYYNGAQRYEQFLQVG